MLITVVAMIASLTCCVSKTINGVLSSEPSFSGIVAEITDDYIVVNVNSDQSIYDTYPVVYASTDVYFSTLSASSLAVGDEIWVTYDGIITGDSPGYADYVYGFTLRNPVYSDSE